MTLSGPVNEKKNGRIAHAEPFVIVGDGEASVVLLKKVDTPLTYSRNMKKPVSTALIPTTLETLTRKLAQHCGRMCVCCTST